MKTLLIFIIFWQVPAFADCGALFTNRINHPSYYRPTDPRYKIAMKNFEALNRAKRNVDSTFIFGPSPIENQNVIAKAIEDISIGKLDKVNEDDVALFYLRTYELQALIRYQTALEVATAKSDNHKNQIESTLKKSIELLIQLKNILGFEIKHRGKTFDYFYKRMIELFDVHEHLQNETNREVYRTQIIGLIEADRKLMYGRF